MEQDTKCQNCGNECYKGETYEFDGKDYCSLECRNIASGINCPFCEGKTNYDLIRHQKLCSQCGLVVV